MSPRDFSLLLLLGGTVGGYDKVSENNRLITQSHSIHSMMVLCCSINQSNPYISLHHGVEKQCTTVQPKQKTDKAEFCTAVAAEYIYVSKNKKQKKNGEKAERASAPAPVIRRWPRTKRHNKKKTEQ